MSDHYSLIGSGLIEITLAQGGVHTVRPGTEVRLTGLREVSLSPQNFMKEHYEIQVGSQPDIKGWVESSQISSAMRAPHDFGGDDLQIAGYSIAYTSHDCDLNGFKACTSITLAGYPYAECYQTENWTVFQFSHSGSGLGVRPTARESDCSIGKRSWAFAFPGKLKSLQENRITVEKENQEITFSLQVF